MSEEDSGGVRGLRVWATDAAERFKRLVPALGAVDVPARAYDASVAELGRLAGLLDHDPGLRSEVSVWLGGALALRRFAGGGEPGDGERAERLLRDVRDPGTALGAAAAEQDRRWAALFLVAIVSPWRQQRGGPGAVPDHSAFVDWSSRVGPAGMTAVAEEIRTLTEEAAELPLPAEFLGELTRMRRLMTTPPGPEYTDLLMSMVPAGDPAADQVRQVLDTVFGGSATAERRDGAPDRPQPPRPSAPPPTPDDLRRYAAARDTLDAATYGLGDAWRSDDPTREINRLLARLRAVQDRPPPGQDPTAALEAVRATLFGIGAGTGGSLQDLSVGRTGMDAISGWFETFTGPLPPGVRNPAMLGRALVLYQRVMAAGETEDIGELRALVDEAEALERSVPADERLRFMAVLALGAAYGRLGAALRDEELMLRALPYLETGMSAFREADLPFAGSLSLPDVQHLVDMARAGLTGEGTDVPEEPHVPPPAGASPENVHASALSALLRYGHTRDPAVLDTAIHELERVRDGVREGRAPRIAAEALWQLAQAYRERGVRNQDVKDLTALEAAQEALTALAADVLLQSGAEHGLTAARAGANRGVQAALWAGSQGRLHEAVAALELGRALVLHAASTSSAVPDLLDAGGHAGLATAWRAAGTSPRPGTGRGLPDELPSTLRRQALQALGYRRQGGLLTTPTLSELADGIAASGADALVYLVPGEGDNPGVVIVVGPHVGAGLAVRPPLSGTGSAPLERYLDATAVRDRDRDDPAAGQAWEEALTALCDWAHEVLEPVLPDLERRLAAEGGRRDVGDERPLRLVLVPCGRLGIVPWHAARFPPGAPHGHLCQRAVISYAASGSQFLRTLTRAPREPAAAPVLLADPSMDLTYAETEVLALRDSFYPRARLCGAFFDPPGEDEEEPPPGTPDEVLAFLTDGTSLLHVASHGSAAPRPTASALHLAAPVATAAPGSSVGEGARTTEPEPEPEPEPDRGRLTVTGILDRADRQALHGTAEDGPLVVLSACETDLSTRDHDEALTLTTAFVAGGARDAVGSRWTVQDSASALLMSVFHHHLTVGGLSPVDALRAAQLWMLDPHRANPGSLHGELLRQSERPDLGRIPLWAAFIHQGHPGPAPLRTGTARPARPTARDA